MRFLFKDDTDIKGLKEKGIIPSGVKIRTDEETGRYYFNYIYRLSTNIDWEKLEPHIEAISNLIISYCKKDNIKPTFEEGVYDYRGENLRLRRVYVFVTVKRNPSSGVVWQEFKIYADRCLPNDKLNTPGEMATAHGYFANGQFTLQQRWSTGEPIECK